LISSDVVRGHVDTVILRLLLEKEMYGYEIANEIKARTQNKFEIKEATLYAVVQRLESKELISSYMGEKSHGGKRRYYRVTPLGRAYYKELIDEWRLLRQIMVEMLGSDAV
jgi:PadR family transcriptional regulator, regulatory protein PadR